MYIVFIILRSEHPLIEKKIDKNSSSEKAKNWKNFQFYLTSLQKKGKIFFASKGAQNRYEKAR